MLRAFSQQPLGSTSCHNAARRYWDQELSEALLEQATQRLAYYDVPGIRL